MGSKTWWIVVWGLLATTASVIAEDDPRARRVPLERAARVDAPLLVREGARLAVTRRADGELPVLIPVSAGAGSRFLAAGAAITSEYIDLTKPRTYCVPPQRETTAEAPMHFDSADAAGVELCSLVQVGANGEVAEWKAELVRESVPATWAPQRGYVASFRVIALPIGSTPEGPIPGELVIRLGGEQVVVEPAEVSIGATGSDGAKRIEVTVARHTDRPRLWVICIESEDVSTHATFDILPRTSTIEVTAATRSILGFGLAGTDLLVTRYAEDGLPLAMEPPLAVVLTCESGLLPGSIEIPQGRSSAGVSFRSKGQGRSVVHARAGSVHAADCPIEQDSPWLYIGLVTAGGAAGALGRRQVQARRGGAKRKLAPYLFLGSLSAVIVVLGGLYGLNTTGLSAPLITTEGGAILIALVVGWIGHAAIDRVKLLLLPKP